MVSEATALPTEPQPLPNSSMLFAETTFGTFLSMFQVRPNPRPLFAHICSFLNTNFTEKTLDFSGIRTRIVVVECTEPLDNYHGPNL